LAKTGDQCRVRTFRELALQGYDREFCRVLVASGCTADPGNALRVLCRFYWCHSLVAGLVTARRALWFPQTAGPILPN
jgi:hypothetical protein